MEKVRKVTTTNYEPAVSRKQEKGLKRVAAYCRVSTLFEEQDQIYNIFRNEIYKGDILTPKHVKLDYKSGKVIRNQGEREQYLIEEHHEPIVPREVFDTVLELVKARKLRSKDKRSKGKSQWKKI